MDWQIIRGPEFVHRFLIAGDSDKMTIRQSFTTDSPFFSLFFKLIKKSIDS